jgi:hypothetical protein
LKIPENIEIVYLPPYSPELNPVEKLWQYIKSHTIKNKVYETIQDLETTICEFIKNLDPKSLACSKMKCNALMCLLKIHAQKGVANEKVPSINRTRKRKDSDVEAI